LSLSDFQERIYSVLNSLPAQKPIFSSSTDFSNKEEYGDVVYLKTAVWCFIIENSIGQDNLDKGMQEYFEKWKFKHPSPEDLQEALEKSSGRDLNRLFDLLYKVGRFN
jgi:aminopeptidase N